MNEEVECHEASYTWGRWLRLVVDTSSTLVADKPRHNNRDPLWN